MDALQDLFATVAQADMLGAPWSASLINYGALGLWVIFMVVRDRQLAVELRERHKEEQKHREDTVRSVDRMVLALMVVVETIKHQDSHMESLKGMAKNVKEQTMEAGASRQG